MKKLLAIVLALSMALSMAVFANAEENPSPSTRIFMSPEVTYINDTVEAGVDALVFENDSVTAPTEANIPLFAISIPEPVPIGESIVIHIIGSSDDDFRVWLLGDSNTDEKGYEATFSNQWKASENGFTAPGEFEKYIELIADDFDAQGGTVGNRIAFKGPSYGVNLSNLTISRLEIMRGTMEDVESSTAEEAKPFSDAAQAALDAANAANGDEAALSTALADAEAAVAALEEKASLGFPTISEMLKNAKDAVKSINNIINSAAESEAVEAISGDVTAVSDALAAAQAAGRDIDAISAALDSAKSAAANISAAAEENGYTAVKTAAREAEDKVAEIELLLQSAQDAKKAADEAAAKAAEEEAAKKKQTTTVIVVVAVVVVLVIVAAAVVMAMKKKKK